MESELVVIGAGPGGYAAAFLAADKGMKVTMIDAAERPGGSCLHVGCIPSKALLHAAKLITDVREANHLGLTFDLKHIDIAGLRAYWQKVVDTMAKNLVDLCKRRHVELVRARATFADSHTLQLDDGSRRSFRHCILATGSSPTRLPTLALDSPRVMDSTAALRFEVNPASLLVVGGGYIGLELGYVYASLGSKVTVVELTDGLLPGVDRTLVRPLHDRLKKLFANIYLSTKVIQLTETPAGIRAKLEGEEVSHKEPVFDRVLVAVGRRPNSQGLGVENTKVQVDDKGFVKVDEHRRTTDHAIYAIGDVAGEPMLAHKASHEGKTAVEAIAGEKAAVFDPRAIPAVVFTDPEIAWCGLTENDAKRMKREIKVVRFPWAASGRAMTLGRTEGLTKLVLDPATEQVLGVGLVGPGAGELIGEGVLAVEMAASAKDLTLIIHAHPTLSETIGEAADTLYGTATHVLRPKR
jgi:dihydrolipoamide dehydrogenase